MPMNFLTSLDRSLSGREDMENNRLTAGFSHDILLTLYSASAFQQPLARRLAKGLSQGSGVAEGTRQL